MSVSRGFYRHYKGQVYWVHGVGTLHDETRRVVIYESTRSAVDGAPRLRYEDDFEAKIDPRTGAVPLEWGVPVAARFERLNDDDVLTLQVEGQDSNGK